MMGSAQETAKSWSKEWKVMTKHFRTVSKIG
jgi:hypothetical protein